MILVAFHIAVLVQKVFLDRQCFIPYIGMFVEADHICRCNYMSVMSAVVILDEWNNSFGMVRMRMCPDKSVD